MDKNMITVLDSMTVIAKQLPEGGVTMREFVTRACRLRGDPESVIEATLKLAADEEGIMEDDIVKIGLAGTKLQ